MMGRKKLNIHLAKQNLQKDLNKLTGKVSHSIRSFDTDTYKIISGDNLKNRRIILLPRDNVKKKENQSNHSNNLKNIKLITPEELENFKSQRFRRDKNIKKDENEKEKEEKVEKEEVKSAYEIIVSPESSESHVQIKSPKPEKENLTDDSKDSFEGSPLKHKKFDAAPTNEKGANNNGKHIDSTDFEESHSKQRRANSSYRYYYDSKYSPRSSKRSAHRRRQHYETEYSDEENCPCCRRKKFDPKTEGFMQQMGTLEKLLSIDPVELRLLSNIISLQNNEKAKVEVVKVVEREKPSCGPLTQYVPPMPSGCFTAQPATIFPAIYQPAPVISCQPQQYFCNEMIQPPSYFSHVSNLACPPYSNCYCCCDHPMYRVI